MPNNSKKGLWIVSGLVVVFAFSWVIAFRYVQSMGEQYRVLEVKLRQEDKKEVYYAATTKDLRGLDDERELLAGAYVHDGEEAEFLELIESLGTKTGIELKINQFDKADKALRMSLVAKGSYSRVYKFISLVESAPQRLVIDRGSIEEIASGETGSVWEGKIDFSALYYQKNKI